MAIDIKQKLVTITIGTLTALLLAVINITYYVANDNANMKRDIIDNSKSVQQLIEYNKIQDMKIENLEKTDHKNDLQFQQILFELREIQKKLK